MVQLRDRVTKAGKQKGQERQNGAAGSQRRFGGKTCSPDALFARVRRAARACASELRADAGAERVAVRQAADVIV
ncbi:hypothetical protein, partial [Bacillus cereus group sp. BC34]|uniref:hypothetical protein n=1 Tax=Bacillus cereus group sp. BC34 TaxID=3445304 RepID=UPI003F288B43